MRENSRIVNHFKINSAQHMVKYIMKFNKSTKHPYPRLPKKEISNCRWRGTGDLENEMVLYQQGQKNPGFGVYNNDLLNKI